MMNSRALVSLLFLLMVPVVADAALFGEDPAPCTSAAGATYETAFSTSAKVSPLVAKTIASAKKSIRVAARQFTSKPVSAALVQAARAGSDLKVVLDRKSNKNGYSDATFLRAMSYPPHIIKNYDNLYLDYMVIDERDIIIGNIAGLPDVEEEKKNPVGVLVIHNAPELAKQYLANWQVLWDASEEMPKARGQHDPL